MLFGRRPIVGEGVLGLLLIPIAFGIAVAVMLTVRRFAPSLHNVTDNPLQGLLTSPRDAWLFALVVLVAGGVREEIQRAFLLHRFDVWLGGGTVGAVVTSVAFGAGHFDLQGVDAGIATGLLGAFWGVVYLRRRSSVAPIVSHAGFDLLQIVPFLDRALTEIRETNGSCLRTRSRPNPLPPSPVPRKYRSITPPRRRRPAIHSSTRVTRRSAAVLKR